MSADGTSIEETLRARMAAHGGSVPFDTFMDTALYEPGLGYYESSHVFGKSGDYVTAVTMGPWLALALADLIAWGWRRLGRPTDWWLLEQGGGDGRLLTDVMAALAELGVGKPSQVIAAERSQAMRQRQKRRYEQAGLGDVMQITELADIEKHDCCLAYCNELPDAFPVRCFTWKSRRFFEREVAWSGNGFAWQLAHTPLAKEPEIDPGLIAAWPEGYESEWNPGLERWQHSLASVIGRGYLFCVDYGYSQAEYYAPQRRRGTLMAHGGHKVYEDVLARPGNRDITAHVDFTALAKAGRRYGFDPVHFMTQGAWLAQSPSVQRRMRDYAASPGEHVAALAAAKRLLLPAGMGEVFKLWVQSRSLDATGAEYLHHFERAQTLRI